MEVDSIRKKVVSSAINGKVLVLNSASKNIYIMRPPDNARRYWISAVTLDYLYVRINCHPATAAYRWRWSAECEKKPCLRMLHPRTLSKAVHDHKSGS